MGLPTITVDGRVLLTQQQAAWLARTTTETIRRWSPAQGRRGQDNLVDYETLKAKAQGRVGPPLHPAWLWLQQDVPVPAEVLSAAIRDGCPMGSVHGQAADVGGEVERLRREIEALKAERDMARLDAQTLDVAAMSYRDNWLRRTQPQHPGPLT